MEILNSKSYKNIKQAFQGECSAIIKYLVAAETAREEGRVAEADLFEKMAINETMHAKVWYKYLNQSKKLDTEGYLKDAADGENEEWKEMYPEFAKTAKEEGFDDLAAMFERIASIECDHERRFLEINMEKKDIENEKSKCDEGLEDKYCIFCGFCSSEKLHICPVCGAEDAFEM